MKKKKSLKGKRPTPKQIVEFIEDMQRLKFQTSDKSRLISIKVPEGLLRAFKLMCEAQGLRYQSQIKVLMYDWLNKKEKAP